MAVYGMVAAQLLFDEDDHVWHLLTEGWLSGGERAMHIRPDDKVSLVPVLGLLLPYKPLSSLALSNNEISEDWFVFSGKHRVHVPGRVMEKGKEQ